MSYFFNFNSVFFCIFFLNVRFQGIKSVKYLISAKTEVNLSCLVYRKHDLSLKSVLLYEFAVIFHVAHSMSSKRKWQYFQNFLTINCCQRFRFSLYVLSCNDGSSFTTIHFFYFDILPIDVSALCQTPRKTKLPYKD